MATPSEPWQWPRPLSDSVAADCGQEIELHIPAPPSEGQSPRPHRKRESAQQLTRTDASLRREWSEEMASGPTDVHMSECAEVSWPERQGIVQGRQGAVLSTDSGATAQPAESDSVSPAAGLLRRESSHRAAVPRVLSRRASTNPPPSTSPPPAAPGSEVAAPNYHQVATVFCLAPNQPTSVVLRHFILTATLICLQVIVASSIFVAAAGGKTCSATRPDVCAVGMFCPGGTDTSERLACIGCMDRIPARILGPDLDDKPFTVTRFWKDLFSPTVFSDEANRRLRTNVTYACNPQNSVAILSATANQTRQSLKVRGKLLDRCMQRRHSFFMKYAVCIFACIFACMHACMHVCMYVRTYVRTYICVYV